jgi:hypothetical protein
MKKVTEIERQRQMSGSDGFDWNIGVQAYVQENQEMKVKEVS